LSAAELLALVVVVAVGSVALGALAALLRNRRERRALEASLPVGTCEWCEERRPLLFQELGRDGWVGGGVMVRACLPCWRIFRAEGRAVRRGGP
jgi:hypothetical protein